MRLTLTLLASLAIAVPAAAQVGYPPSASPYRDILPGHSITALYGRFGGGGGRFGIGAHGGNIFGARYDVRTAGAIQFGLTVARGSLERLVVDPFVQLARRTTGPVSQHVTFADVSLQLNLTGAKTWHRLAPYAGVSLGVAFAEATPSDTSGYSFGNKFYFAPQVGTRLFLTDRLHLRADVRGLFWKLKYPDSFGLEPALEPGTATSPNAVITDNRFSEWALSPWIQLGLGYSFHF